MEPLSLLALLSPALSAGIVCVVAVSSLLALLMVCVTVALLSRRPNGADLIEAFAYVLHAYRRRPETRFRHKASDDEVEHPPRFNRVA